MSINIIRAWKDPEYRQSLSAAELSVLPAHPAGFTELTEEEIRAVSGGVTGSGQPFNLSPPSLLTPPKGNGLTLGRFDLRPDPADGRLDPQGDPSFDPPNLLNPEHGPDDGTGPSTIVGVSVTGGNWTVTAGAVPSDTAAHPGAGIGVTYRF